MKDQYSHDEVIKILECIQWLALSKKTRLMSADKSFKTHANAVIVICISTPTMKETIDNLIDYSIKP